MCGWSNQVSLVYVWISFHFNADLKPLLIFHENEAIPQQAANRIQYWGWKLA